MTRKQIFTSVLLTTLIVALFFAAPWFFPQKLVPKEATDVLRRTPSPWQGVLQLWQVNTWRVGRGSRSALAQLASTRFEKGHIGVYVELIGMTTEEFDKRWAAGERPDVISFPDGWTGLEGVELLPLKGTATPVLMPPFAGAFEAQGEALPWMAGGAVVLINNEVGRAVGVEPPIADKSWTVQALLDYAQSAAGGRRKKPLQAIVGAAPTWDSLALAGADLTTLKAKGLLTEDALTLSIDGARERFAAGKAAVLLATQWEAALMERLAARNKAFDYTVLPTPIDAPPVLNVQYIAALQSNDDDHNRMASELAYTFVSPAVQKKVAASACLPVVALPDKELPKGELEGLLTAQLPMAWLPVALTGRDDGLVAAALQGDSAAAQTLCLRYQH